MADELRSVLSYPALIEAIASAFRDGIAPPLRHHHAVPGGTLLLMPAWRAGSVMGVKLVSVFPGNVDRRMPAVQGVYMLLDGQTGAPLAAMEGTVLTARRTAAASALASRYLSRPDSEHLLIVGTGAVAAELAAAHGAVRPLRRVTVWGRRRAEAERLAAQIAAAGMPAQPSSDLAESVAAADIISCATMSTTPLLRGAWLQAGQHVDLIGGYNQTMREADDEAVRRARVFVDTYTGALAEPGDIVQPIEAGVLRREDLCGDLYELTQGQRPGRQSEKEITLFKSVGSAVEDLAAAELAWRRLQ